MREHFVTLLCEGPACNGGISAKEREGQIFASTRLKMGDEEARKAAAERVTKQLAYTTHRVTESPNAQCTICRHVRRWG
jgi:hypothetical protein